MTDISKAVDGLLYSSESDYPLTPFTWKETGPVSPEMLLKAANLPPGTAVTNVDFDAFFAPMLRLREGASARLNSAWADQTLWTEPCSWWRTDRKTCKKVVL